MSSLIQEKLQQAAEILVEQDIDLWLTFVRETSAGGDPVLPLIYGHDLTWQSALIITRSDNRIAIIGRYEMDAAKSVGAYDVIGYDEGVSKPLLETLARLNPRTIAINFSRNDVLADGLSHGMHQLLTEYLSGTPYASRLVSAEKVIMALRCRKTPAEIERITKAVRTTEQMYARTFEFLAPGLSEMEVGEFMHAQTATLGLETAWEYASCPAVNAGPDSPVGHAGPTGIRIAPGQVLHFDFGVRENEYCSDIQRVAYVLRPGEAAPPPEVVHGFETVVRAIREAVNAMRPGITGYEIDQIARGVITGAGYPAYKYATGHHVGRLAHDGGGILGPRWERYGETPNQPLEVGHVYAVEPGLMIPGFGYIGIEENVLVTGEGAVFISHPQTEMILVQG